MSIKARGNDSIVVWMEDADIYPLRLVSKYNSMRFLDMSKKYRDVSQHFSTNPFRVVNHSKSYIFSYNGKDNNLSNYKETYTMLNTIHYISNFFDGFDRVDDICDNTPSYITNMHINILSNIDMIY